MKSSFLFIQIKATGYLMRSFPITVHKGNVTNIRVIMSSVGHGYTTQEYKTLVKGNFSTFI